MSRSINQIDVLGGLFVLFVCLFVCLLVWFGLCADVYVILFDGLVRLTLHLWLVQVNVVFCCCWCYCRRRRRRCRGGGGGRGRVWQCVFCFIGDRVLIDVTVM